MNIRCKLIPDNTWNLFNPENFVMGTLNLGRNESKNLLGEHFPKNNLGKFTSAYIFKYVVVRFKVPNMVNTSQNKFKTRSQNYPS